MRVLTFAVDRNDIHGLTCPRCTGLGKRGEEDPCSMCKGKSHMWLVPVPDRYHEEVSMAQHTVRTVELTEEHKAKLKALGIDWTKIDWAKVAQIIQLLVSLFGLTTPKQLAAAVGCDDDCAEAMHAAAQCDLEAARLCLECCCNQGGGGTP